MKPLLIAAVVGGLLIVLQIGLPIYLEGRVEDRLTRDGGTAQVDLDAIPSARLLLEDGDRLDVRGSGYRLPLAGPEEKVFERVDGFDDVNVDLSSFRAGPVVVDRFRLTREGGGDFRMQMDGSATGRELAGYAGGEIAGDLGELFARLGSDLLPGTAAPIPVTIDATLENDAGRPKVTSVEGSIAGLPAGPLAEAIAGGIADRL